MQAFSWGVHLPALEKGGDGHTVAMVGCWVVISVGVGLAVLGIVSEACLSISCISVEPALAACNRHLQVLERAYTYRVIRREKRFDSAAASDTLEGGIGGDELATVREDPHHLGEYRFWPFPPVPPAATTMPACLLL